MQVVASLTSEVTRLQAAVAAAEAAKKKDADAAVALQDNNTRLIKVLWRWLLLDHHERWFLHAVSYCL